jgi:hypothetical protein
VAWPKNLKAGAVNPGRGMGRPGCWAGDSGQSLANFVQNWWKRGPLFRKVCFLFFSSLIIGKSKNYYTLLADIYKDNFNSKGKMPSKGKITRRLNFSAKLARKVCQELAKLLCWQDNRISSEPTPPPPLAPSSINRVLSSSGGENACIFHS